MKILWFEVSIPAKYKNTGKVVTGWQDALELAVRQYTHVDLYIAFECKTECSIKKIDGVTYIPIHTKYSFTEKIKRKFSWLTYANNLIKECIPIVNKVEPDIIHVFGNEWPFGFIAEHTDKPVVIHIQGSIIPYTNAMYPPGYNVCSLIQTAGFNLYEQYRILKKQLNDKSRLKMEKRIWKLVSHYMGRTAWDRALVNVLHPNATYHHVDEALRSDFIKTIKKWSLEECSGKIKLVTTGCSNFWKGVDMILKTANILRMNKIDFEWNVAGQINPQVKKTVERKEGMTFSDNNIRILGFVNPKELIDLLCYSNMYVHTAYIENSPNSICEAQYLGLPIISTMVGGISTLVRNGINGILVPANDPWQMANAIIELSKDKERMKKYSSNNIVIAHERHSARKIVSQLMSCYNDLIINYNKDK